MATRTAQARFWQYEDTPLWSGCAPVYHEPDLPQRAPRPATKRMFGCGLCQDTGRTSAGFCWCDAGVQARRLVEKAGPGNP